MCTHINIKVKMFIRICHNNLNNQYIAITEVSKKVKIKPCFGLKSNNFNHNQLFLKLRKF